MYALNSALSWKSVGWGKGMNQGVRSKTIKHNFVVDSHPQVNKRWDLKSYITVMKKENCKVSLCIETQVEFREVMNSREM